MELKGKRNLMEVLDAKVVPEILSGDNGYKPEGYSEKQDAQIGMKFLSLPPVLGMTLQRSFYDFEKDAMVKTNSRFEYPLFMDVSPYMQYPKGPEIYHLYR